MYAIACMDGKDYKLEEGRFVYLPRLGVKTNGQVDFKDVRLLCGSDGLINVGKPTLKGVVVSGTVLSQVQGDKVIVFKKKRRKGYAVKNGHRQPYSKVRIDSIKSK